MFFVATFLDNVYIYIRSTPHPVTVTTRSITFLVGNPYKPPFATVTGWGVDPTYIYIYASLWEAFFLTLDGLILYLLSYIRPG